MVGCLGILGTLRRDWDANRRLRPSSYENQTTHRTSRAEHLRPFERFEGSDRFMNTRERSLCRATSCEFVDHSTASYFYFARNVFNAPPQAIT